MSDSFLINNKLRVKESNTNLVITSIKRTNTATCAEISKDTGLSVATCGNIIKRLLASGEILDGGYENNSSGSPAKQYIYNKNFRLVTAITVHAEHSVRFLQYAVADLYGEILEKDFKKCSEITPSAISSLVSELTSRHQNIRAIGFGVPAIVDNKGVVMNSDIPELNSANIYDLTRTSNTDIKIAADRSPSLSIYGYCKSHPELKGTISAAILCPQEPPIGAGFVINDQIYNGYYNIGGETGFMAKKFLDRFMPAENEMDRNIRDTMFTIASIISTVNPSTLVLMGADFSDDFCDKIRSYCDELFDRSFMPEFVILKDYSDAYIRGTVQIAIDCLEPRIRLVRE